MAKIIKFYKSFLLIIVLIFCFFVNNAEAITVNFEWQGKTGYLVKGTLTYDDKESPNIIIEKGQGQTNYLQDLSVSIYNANHELLKTYQNIKNGIATGQYFQVNFDTQHKQLTGKIDLGGEVLGDVYLKGKVKENLSLFKVDQVNHETILDQDNGNIKSLLTHSA